MIKLKTLIGKKTSKKKVIKEAQMSWKGIFDYNPQNPHTAGRSFADMFNGAEDGYSESWDNFGWNDDKNWQKAVDEYHKEMFKFVDEYIKTTRKAQKFSNIQDKIFKKWRKTDGSKAGD